MLLISSCLAHLQLVLSCEASTVEVISISDLSFPDSVGTQLATITAGLITPQKGQQKRQPRFNRDIMR